LKKKREKEIIRNSNARIAVKAIVGKEKGSREPYPKRKSGGGGVGTAFTLGKRGTRSNFKGQRGGRFA